MATEDRPQINLITPPAFDLETDPARLAAVLDAVEIACLRISLATRDEMELIRAADQKAEEEAMAWCEAQGVPSGCG